MFGWINKILPKPRAGKGCMAKRGFASRSPVESTSLTGLADRADEILTRPGEPDNNHRDDLENKAFALPLCNCIHPTHFLGRCQNQVSSPEHTCSECMGVHFHRADDPGI